MKAPEDALSARWLFEAEFGSRRLMIIDNPNPYLPSLGIVQRRRDLNSATNKTIIKPGAVMATHFLEFLRYAGSQICIVTAHREP